MRKWVECNTNFFPFEFFSSLPIFSHHWLLQDPMHNHSNRFSKPNQSFFFLNRDHQCIFILFHSMIQVITIGYLVSETMSELRQSILHFNKHTALVCFFSESWFLCCGCSLRWQKVMRKLNIRPYVNSAELGLLKTSGCCCSDSIWGCVISRHNKGCERIHSYQQKKGVHKEEESGQSVSRNKKKAHWWLRWEIYHHHNSDIRQQSFSALESSHRELPLHKLRCRILVVLQVLMLVLDHS